jgi:hypothetical protein
LQYRDKPKARATIKLVVDVLFADMLIIDVQNAYNLETAIGVQLDILGKWVGVTRNYKGFAYDNEPAFAFLTYDDLTPTPIIQKGFSTYSTFDTKEGLFLTYDDIITVNNLLNDDFYRLLIKMHIVRNTTNNSLKDIDDRLYRYFDNTVIATENGKKRMTYFLPEDWKTFRNVFVEKDSLPRPMGVLIDYHILFTPDDKFFGFATYDNLLSGFLKTGFSTYSTFDTKEGKLINYDDLLEA